MKTLSLNLHDKFTSFFGGEVPFNCSITVYGFYTERIPVGFLVENCSVVSVVVGG